MSSYPHVSVLEEEVVSLLAPRDGGLYCDGTLGAGGHTARLLRESSPTGRVIGVDRDESALAIAKERLESFGERAIFVHGTFAGLPTHLQSLGNPLLDGLLLDLGVSSMQLDRGERGFSFAQSGPIDMRMNPSEGETALDLIESRSAEELATILFEYGEERFSRRIAARMKEAASRDELTDTLVLADLVASCIPSKLKQKSRLHPATRTFQALRIAVNRELGELHDFLQCFPDLLAPGGRCAIISFHSLEDRMVKRCFRDLAKTSNLPANLARQAGERVDPICIPITRKPVIATDSERDINPRSRSAKLRVCERAAS